MEYIEGICRTNLDGYDCTKVTMFVAVPRTGDKVYVLKEGYETILTVISITHTIRCINNICQPYIIVQLSK